MSVSYEQETQNLLHNPTQETATTAENAPGRAIVGIVLGVLTYWLFSQAIFNVVPNILHDIPMVPETLNIAISLAALVCGCVIVVAGGFADKFGRVKVTKIGFALSIISSVCLIAAQGPVLFVVGRILQGFSAACIMAATLALIKTIYHGKARQRALSFWSIGSWGGGGIATFAGGVIATSLGWRWIFIFSLASAALGLFLIRGIPESRVENEEKKHAFDYKGMAVFVGFMVLLSFCLTQGSHYGWGSVLMLALCAGVVALGVVFYALEKRAARAAFIDLSLFKNRPYSGATFSNFLLNAMATGALFVMNIYLQDGRGFTPFQSGMLTLGYLVSTLAMIPVGERLLQNIGARKPLVWGAMSSCIGTLFMAFTFLPDAMYLAMSAVGFVLYGLGFGLTATPSTDTAIAAAPADRAGVAAGIYKMGSSLGGAMGLTISASVHTTLPTLGLSASSSAAGGLIANVIFGLIAVAAVLILVPRQQMNLSE